MMYLSHAQQCLTKVTAELNNINQRADKVHKEALELEKAVDVAAKTVCHLPWSPCVREFSQHTPFYFLPKTPKITRFENTVVGETELSHEVHIWMFLTAPATSSLFGGKIISP